MNTTSHRGAFAMLLISNLPRGTTPKILLDALSPAAPFSGGVFDLVIVPPSPSTNPEATEPGSTATAPIQPTDTAALVMWTKESTRRVCMHIRHGKLVIEGRVARVKFKLRLHNDGKVPLGPPKEGQLGRTRVLIVSGRDLENGLVSNVGVQSVETIVPPSGYTGLEGTVVWTFVTAGRAEYAKRTLESFGQFSRVTSVRYGVDPAEVGVVTALAMNRAAGQRSQVDSMAKETARNGGIIAAGPKRFAGA